MKTRNLTVRRLKKLLAPLALLLCLSFGTVISAGAVSLTVDAAPAAAQVFVQNGATYVPLRAVSKLLAPGASVSWENGRAVVRTGSLTLTARPGDLYLEANGRMLFAAGGVQAVNGSTMVPIRVLAKAFGASVSWDGATGTVSVSRGSGTITPGGSYYDADSVLWLSRIIEAESGGEPLLGKVAVGDVILNRTKTPGFPDTIYGVIFDDAGGVQFEPVANGTIYNTPSDESVLAAKLCLDGASVVGGSVFFLNPAISTNFWTLQNRDYVATIGNHEFFA